MFNKLMIFFSIIIILITMNSNYHFHNSHIDNHHNNSHYHHHIEVDFYDGTTEQSNLHHVEHTQYLENIGIISSVLLVLLFIGINFSFLLLPRTKVSAKQNSKILFCRYFFIYPPPILIRSILFHAPPNNHS
ncbi:MAG: hypothetical protein L3J10_01220 [Sulfurimonas sp.]|nr:hypothetical protein [Sulfurimonas sp.]